MNRRVLFQLVRLLNKTLFDVYGRKVPNNDEIKSVEGMRSLFNTKLNCRRLQKEQLSPFAKRAIVAVCKKSNCRRLQKEQSWKEEGTHV